MQLKSVITQHKAQGVEAVQAGVKQYMDQNPQMSSEEKQFIRINLLQNSQGPTGGIVKTVKELKPGMQETLKRLRADEVQSKHGLRPEQVANLGFEGQRTNCPSAASINHRRC